jgi:hypothetical protein
MLPGVGEDLPLTRDATFRPRAAVLIEPVSADSLPKTGIFAETAGDFRRFRLRFGKAGVRRPKRMREKPGFPAHSRVSWEAWQTAGMRG